MHLRIMKTCVLLSWITTAVCLLLKPLPVKALVSNPLSVSCDERLLDIIEETQNFDLLLPPGTCVIAPLSGDLKILSHKLSTCVAAGWGNSKLVNRSYGCSVVVGKKFAITRFHEPAPPQRKLEWGTFFKTCRELADWIAVTLRRSPNVCMPFLGFDLIDGMGIQKVGCVKINAETLCVFELASASSWTNGRPTFLWQTSLLVHLCLPASISSGALTSLGMRLQLFDKNGPADLLPLLCALWSLRCHGEVGGDDSPLASLLSCGLGDIDALWRDLREGVHCEPLFSDDACCGSGGSNQPHVCDMPAMELDGGSHFEDYIVSCLTGRNEIVVSSCDEDVHVCQVTPNNLENRLIRERDNRIRTARLVKQLGVSDEQLWQDASVGSKVESLFGLSMVEPRTAPPLIAADLPL